MSFLKQLGIESINPGAAVGTNFIKGNESQTLDSINPSDDTVIASITLADEKVYETVTSQAHQAFLKWREVPAPVRGEFIRKIANELRAHKDALGSLVAMEMGKTKIEGDGEVQEMIDVADYAVGLSRMLYGKNIPSERPHHRIQEQWHPLGVVGVISAFNFPVAVWSWNAFIAAVCGDTVVWKPSSKTPLCTIAVQNICAKVMKDTGHEGVFSYYIATRSARDLMLNDKRYPLVSFTGSTSVGRTVGATVGKRLGRTILELGGNNAIIVDDTADFKLAIPAVVFGTIGTSGQRCTATRRVIIHESIYDKFVETLLKSYEKITIGNPLEKTNFMGPLVDKSAVKLFQETLDEVKMHHGKVLFGGEVVDGPGCFVQPTVVAADNDNPIVQKESFVPVVYLMKFKTIEQAIEMQNHSDYGLSSAIFTNNYSNAESFLSATGSDCGLANVNIGTSGAEIGGAFGGEKDTGGGRESGSDAWKAYMRRQTATVNWGHQLPLAQGIIFDF